MDPVNSPLQAEIILIGNELLIGKIVDTNGQWLIKRLLEHGCFVTRVTTIPDNVDIVAGAVQEAVARSPRYILTSGGLGPTFDDMTLEGVTKGLGVPLEQDPIALEMLRQRYLKVQQMLKPHLLEKVLTHARLKMSFLPQGAVALQNAEGAAPGVQYEVPGQNTVLFCLPGIPRELMSIYDLGIDPQIANEHVEFIDENFYSTGIGESDISDFVMQLMHEIPGIWIKSHPKGRRGAEPIVEWQVTSFGEEEMKANVDQAIAAIKEEITRLNGEISDNNPLEEKQ